MELISQELKDLLKDLSGDEQMVFLMLVGSVGDIAEKLSYFKNDNKSVLGNKDYNRLSLAGEISKCISLSLKMLEILNVNDDKIKDLLELKAKELWLLERRRVA